MEEEEDMVVCRGVEAWDWGLGVARGCGKQKAEVLYL
jgi:hypothetical protein